MLAKGFCANRTCYKLRNCCQWWAISNHYKEAENSCFLQFDSSYTNWICIRWAFELSMLSLAFDMHVSTCTCVYNNCIGCNVFLKYCDFQVGTKNKIDAPENWKQSLLLKKLKTIMLLLVCDYIILQVICFYQLWTLSQLESHSTSGIHCSRDLYKYYRHTYKRTCMSNAKLSIESSNAHLIHIQFV